MNFYITSLEDLTEAKYKAINTEHHIEKHQKLKEKLSKKGRVFQLIWL